MVCNADKNVKNLFKIKYLLMHNMLLCIIYEETLINFFKTKKLNICDRKKVSASFK